MMSIDSRILWSGPKIVFLKNTMNDIGGIGKFEFIPSFIKKVFTGALM
jgi:hypothetical protein